jgi:hypothetical protein
MANPVVECEDYLEALIAIDGLVEEYVDGDLHPDQVIAEVNIVLSRVLS